MIGSSQSWGPQQHPLSWHSRAGGGAVHSINSGHDRMLACCPLTSNCRHYIGTMRHFVAAIVCPLRANTGKIVRGCSNSASSQLRLSCLRTLSFEKPDAIPVTIVTSITSNMASNEPSPWSGEKPKYLSIKSTRLCPTSFQVAATLLGTNLLNAVSLVQTTCSLQHRATRLRKA